MSRVLWAAEQKGNMASDAHAHPYDLSRIDPSAESRRIALDVPCAASAWNEEEFLFNERLAAAAAEAGGPPVVPCFGVHPQLPAAGLGADSGRPAPHEASFAFLERLVAEKRVRAIGEAGFDLFDAGFRATAAVQEDLFRAQLALARSASLPMVLHLRRAARELFAHSRGLAALPAVILHSYSGTLREAIDIMKRGVNAYFSFGTPIRLNHKRAMEACAGLPADRVLFETDAPYQPPRGRETSTWSDLAAVIDAAAELRATAGNEGADRLELEATSDANFRRAYGLE